MRYLPPVTNLRGVSVGFMLIQFILSGCVSYHEVLQGAPAGPAPISTVTPSEHSLAILDIDFDPPLDDWQILQRGITLLVAVHNQGLADEADVYISVRLTDPEADFAVRELMNDTVVVRSLPAGKMQVVAFPPFSGLPPQRERFLLEVEIEPVPGEVDTRDNVRTYEITVRQEEPYSMHED